jgi:hypothetical protein
VTNKNALNMDKAAALPGCWRFVQGKGDAQARKMAAITPSRRWA